MRSDFERAGDGEVVDAEVVAVRDAFELDQLISDGVAPFDGAGNGFGGGVAGGGVEDRRAVDSS